MGKLGKKARKFAQKNLQSVLRKQRKYRSKLDSFKRKKNSVNNRDSAEDHGRVMTNQTTRGNPDGMIANGALGDDFLNNLFSEDDDSSTEDVSDSDGFLSEDPDCGYISESENENNSEDKSDCTTIMGQNKEIHLELAMQKRKLERLREKDPEFSDFLENHRDLKQSRSSETYSDEEGEISDQGEAKGNEGIVLLEGKVFTSYTIDVWSWLLMEQPNGIALPNLLNAFRAACHYGIGDSDELSWQKIPNREVFSKIMILVLCEADGVFRRLLGISDSCCKESIVKLKNTAEWKTVRPLLESYLRSTLFLLNHLTDSQIIAFALSRVRASIVFFVAFPSLVGRLIKITVHFWATGEGSLSLSSFFILQDIASHLSSNCLDICLTKTYKAFISRCKFVGSTNLKHIEFLEDSIVELHSLDVQSSYEKVLVALQQLAKILQHALKTKKKEELKKIYNWQYINCIDLWVKFISSNIRDHDLRPLLYLIIQIIKGVAHLFTGPRYLPLRLKCVQMLNQLSHSSGVFIPIASLLLDSLEYRGINNAGTRPREAINVSTLLKVPKQLLKSQDFHEQCILSAVELLSAHFAQWSYHISFPELATIPLILLKRFHEKLTVESVRRSLKRLIDQVEQNSEFVQRKRDGVAFSPNDQASAESFLQVEKSSGNAPFIQYYTSVRQKSISRNMGIR